MKSKHPNLILFNYPSQQPPPTPGQPYEITDFLDRVHAAGCRVVPGSLRWVVVDGKERVVVRVEKVK